MEISELKKLKLRITNIRNRDRDSNDDFKSGWTALREKVVGMIANEIKLSASNTKPIEVKKETINVAKVETKKSKPKGKIKK